ncbi:hypothetical protein LIA77_02398 [Sarocladium implicatum]|nr:hypothetical protein LIA77_02398 [Sarocladium implicatum]
MDESGVIDEDLLHLLPDHLLSFLTATERHSPMDFRRLAVCLKRRFVVDKQAYLVVSHCLVRAFFMALKRIPAFAGIVLIPSGDYPTSMFRLVFENAWKKPSDPFIIRPDLVEVEKFRAREAHIPNTAKVKIRRGLVDSYFFPTSNMEQTADG